MNKQVLIRAWKRDLEEKRAMKAFVHQDKDTFSRKKHNQELIRRMRNGDNLKSFDNYASWYPPRPVIKKDISAIAKLYKPTEK